jgi:amino acid transporter
MAEGRSGDPDDDVAPRGGEVRLPRARWHLLLLLIPFVALLYPAFYAGAAPRLWGIPFFIWYQFAWVIGGVIVTVAVYAIDRGMSRDQR